MSESNSENTQVENTSDVEYLRKELEAVRKEAAKYRTERNKALESVDSTVKEWESKVTGLQSKVDDLTQKLELSQADALRVKVALDAGIESKKVADFAELLNGNTEEELVSHAAKIKELFTQPPSETKEKATDPTQGKGNATPLNGDPLLSAVMGILNKKG